MKSHSLLTAWFAAASILIAAPGAGASEQVAQTKHNLSASGRGTIKSSGTQEICIFCHTPHNAHPSQALWNRELPGITYRLYQSDTLEASLSQPTGSSRLCLSCHDGTIALGKLRVSPESGSVELGPLHGPGSLGTDLSDDHPISFVYDAGLAARRSELVAPTELPHTVPLDATQQMQCTSCHDAHDDRQGKFLRVSTRYGELCLACHRITGWSRSSHATSSVIVDHDGTSETVAERGCASCHRAHAAARPAHLLAAAQEPQLCVRCHNGQVASTNLEQEFRKWSSHPVETTASQHQATEDPLRMPRHVTCSDCHHAHQTGAMPGAMRGVSGVTLSGTPVMPATQPYEVCFKCHGVESQASMGVVRHDDTRNVRLEFDPANASVHPIVGGMRNPGLAGLLPEAGVSGVLSCADCHTSDEQGAASPRGPHGSRFEPLLEREYQQTDPSADSAQHYALCYKCHSRTSLFAPGRFPHATHVQGAQTSCAVCHDAHGSRLSPGLINFLRRDKAGKPVVEPNAAASRLEYRSLGAGHGECSLTCHGAQHDHRTY